MSRRRVDDRRVESLDAIADGLNAGAEPGVPGPPWMIGSEIARLDDPVVPAGTAAPSRRKAAWRDEWMRRWRTYRIPDQLAAYTEELGAAREPDEIYEALLNHATRTVGAYGCLLVDPAGASSAECALQRSSLQLQIDPIDLPASGAFSRVGVVSAPDALEPDGDSACLLPVFEATGAAFLAHAPFGADGTLILVERRTDREFLAEDWSLLRILTLQAEAALERVGLATRSAGLALDPTTGLISAEHLRDVLEHAWTHALLSGGLVVALIHLYELPDVRAAYGAGMSDQLFRRVAEIIRRETQRTDMAVRYGSDECLLLLPEGKPDEVERLLHQVASRLERLVKVRIGIATYTPEIGSIDELIRDATRSCYHFSPAPAGAGVR